MDREPKPGATPVEATVAESVSGQKNTRFPERNGRIRPAWEIATDHAELIDILSMEGRE